MLVEHLPKGKGRLSNAYLRPMTNKLGQVAGEQDIIEEAEGTSQTHEGYEWEPVETSLIEMEERLEHEGMVKKGEWEVAILPVSVGKNRNVGHRQRFLASLQFGDMRGREENHFAGFMEKAIGTEAIALIAKLDFARMRK